MVECKFSRKERKLLKDAGFSGKEISSLKFSCERKFEEEIKEEAEIVGAYGRQKKR